MMLNRFRSNLSDAQWGRRLWFGVASSMVVSNIMLVTFLVTSDMHEKIVFVPPEIEQPFWIHGEEASPEYLIQVAEWFTSLALSYTPKNVDYRSSVFLRYAAPESLGTLQSHLQDEAIRIKRNEMTSMFYPVDAKVRDDYVAIIGQQVLRVGKEIVSDNRIAYRMRFRRQGGFIQILEFKEVNRDNPFVIDDLSATK